MKLDDNADAVAKLSLSELNTAIPHIQRMSARTRAFAARRWCRLRWPGDDPQLHYGEAAAIFGKQVQLC